MKQIAFVTLLGVLLAGCFISEQPKFSATSAAPAFGEGGRYRQFEHVSGDTYRETEPLLVRRRPDGAYDFSNADGSGKVATISFHAIGRGLHVGQSQTDKEWGYIVMRFEGVEALLHLPACDGQDRASLAALGVTFSGEYKCLIDQVADPVALFAGVDLGAPVAKLLGNQDGKAGMQ